MKRLLALRCLFSVRTSKERERSLYLNRCPSLVKTPRVLIGRRMCLHASRCRSGSVYFLSHLPCPHHPLPGQSVFQRRTRVSSSALRAKPGAEPKPSPCECTPACRETNKRIQKSTPWNAKYIRQQAWQFRWQSSLVIMTKLCGKSTEWGKGEWLMRKEAVRCIIESLMQRCCPQTQLLIRASQSWLSQSGVRSKAGFLADQVWHGVRVEDHVWLRGHSKWNAVAYWEVWGVFSVVPVRLLFCELLTL